MELPLSIILYWNYKHRLKYIQALHRSLRQKSAIDKRVADFQDYRFLGQFSTAS